MRIPLVDNNIDINRYVKALLEKQGKDFTRCELCGKKLTKRPNMHHEKYEGATLKDIKIVCQSCNTKNFNKNLA